MAQAEPAVGSHAGAARAAAGRPAGRAAAFGLRFVHGMRFAGPVSIGSSAMDGRRFALFNVLGAPTWAKSSAGPGGLFGTAVDALLGDLHRIERVLSVAPPA